MSNHFANFAKNMFWATILNGPNNPFFVDKIGGRNELLL